MGRLFLISLEGRFYSCKHCQTHLGHSDDVISKSFYNSDGKASLFEKLVNVTYGEKEKRMLMSGMHNVTDLFCVGYGYLVGWKYEAAHEKNPKYKEGKLLLQRVRILGPNGTNYIDHDDQLVGSDEDE